MKILVLGDTHGYEPAAFGAVDFCVRQGVDAIFQVGDFGLWGKGNRLRAGTFVENLSIYAKSAGKKVYWIPGNHEHWVKYLKVINRGERDDDGFVSFDAAGMIWGAPPAHTWKWDSLVFASIGGAYSVDRKYRRLGESWFREELPLWEYVDQMPDDADVFLSHDAPFNLARMYGWNNGIVINEPEEAEQSQAVIYRAYMMTQPSLGIHGHWHWWGSYPIAYDNNGTTGLVQGLNQSSGVSLQKSSVILDTEFKSCYTVDQFIYEGTPFWQLN